MVIPVSSIATGDIQSLAEEITEDTYIRRDLALDSLSLVNLAVAIEEEFELEIPDRAVVGIETVADVIAIIEEYKDED